MKLRFYSGDPAGAMYAARQILIESPKAVQARTAATVVRDLISAGPPTAIQFTATEQLARAKSLMETGDNDEAVPVLDTIHPSSGFQAEQIALQKGIALSRLRKYEESNKVLEPLTSREYKVAIPALAVLSENYSAAFRGHRSHPVQDRNFAGNRPEPGKCPKERRSSGSLCTGR